MNFMLNLQPIHLVTSSIDLAMPGKIPAGLTDIPFEFPLKPRSGRSLYETYHGVFVNIQYLVKADLKRSFLNKDLSKSQEFIVEYKVRMFKNGCCWSYCLATELIHFNLSDWTARISNC